jgi:GNAT superfamily N-acetyltransferase
MITINEVQNEKGATCDRILRALPTWFGIESAIVEYTRDVESMPMFVAEGDQGNTIAFLSLNFHNQFNAEIHVMGVLPDFHGKGLGTALVCAVEEYAREKGTRYLTVKTLSPARPDHGYEMTRRFYQSVGFVPLEEFKTLWGEANPCLLMIKSL